MTLKQNKIISLSLLVLFTIAAILQWIHVGMALLLGVALAVGVGNPFQDLTHKIASQLLKASVVGLGFSLNLPILWQQAQSSFLLTIVSITIALSMGLFLGKRLGVEDKLSYLITSGTAICGGSAIAAMAPTVKASQHQVIVAISIVFILNGLALYIFPYLGHFFNLSQQQFGIWAALGIHDTSSVVGAASVFGDDALFTATTVKLTRALWIIPLVFAASWFQKDSSTRTKFPAFILLFVVAAGINSLIPQINQFSPMIVTWAKTGMAISLLLMGAGLTKQTLQSVDFKPMLQGMLLWIIVSASSLFLVLWIK